ncbi:hypothetical protein OJAV_G00175110 [Oryzias javanicus]|uniref:Zona pellucida sperm-binding protein 4 n=1 Tax=Oryzias javanicus TaxID=123683 RepID=A0A3S2NXU1_ORYJA|nr:hypothetical protein OJAV_G00175110 [Oryzias javanicus]
MGLFKWLFGVVLLACGASAQNHWTPQKHQPLFPHQAQPPVTAFDKCDVEEGDKIECGTSDVTAEQCVEINCCFDGWKCHYGKGVTVQCTRDGQFVVVVAKDTTVPPIDVNSISLLESDGDFCGPVDSTSAFAIFQFPVTACGTTLKDDENYVVYENHMSSSYEVGVGPRGSITRDSHFELLFMCKYSGSAVEALILEVNPVPAPQPVAALGPLRVELRLANGQCFAKGCVEGKVLGRSDPNLILNLEHCWATATPNPQSLPQWDLLVNGCPYQDDRYSTVLVPVDGSSGLKYPTHYKRFISKMFTFVVPETYTPQETVYIHCATAVCYPSSADSCDQRCHRQRRAAVKIPSSQKALVSSGEVILVKSPTSHLKS